MTTKARNLADLGSNDVLETTSTGVEVTGDVSTSTLTIDGTTVAATATELNYIDGVTSSIQTQLDGKATTAQGALADSAVQPDDDTSLGDLTVDQATLKAIAETKADTAVDVFVYDTRKDSDGGAWRKRTQHTSWYNETLNTATRGSRKEFPAVAVIVAEADKVTIYDGDDPSMPMWWTVLGSYSNSGDSLFYKNTLDDNSGASLSAINGSVALGISYGNQNGGLRVLDFAGDVVKRITANTTYNGYWNSIESIRNGTADIRDSSIERIVNHTVNDIAMTVLPDAPIDPATGLPTPTIAVATNGGVSVIKDDGSVVDITITQTYKGANKIAFTEDNKIAFSAQQSGGSTAYWRYIVGEIPSSDVSYAYWNNYVALDDWNVFDYCEYGSRYPTLAAQSLQAGSISDIAPSGDVSGNKGLTKFNLANPEEHSMVSYVASNYNTGWMNGDIKLATLSDTDLVDAGSSYDPSGITYRDSGRITSHTYVTGATTWQVVDDTSNSTAGYFGLTIPTVEGVTYTIYHTMDQTPPATQRHHVQHVDGDNSVDYFGDVGQLSDSITFIAQGAETRFVVYSANDVTTTHTINIVYGVPNRTVSGVSDNTHLEPYGTVTKTPVATGADLVAYSGFSGTNYLLQPNNSGLDIGTEDFSVMYWVNVSDLSGTQIYWSIANPIVNNNRTAVYTLSTGDTRFFLRQNSTEDIYGTGAGGLVTNKWTHIAAVRSGNTLLLYIDGELKASGATTKSIAQTDKELKIGVDWDVTSANASGSSMALFRYSLTAPTAKQIEKMYNDEKVLFQENAKATLYGSSDAVTALAYDEDTELLHAGTSEGRSVFQGLRRVDNTTDPVGAAISASNGLVVEE